MGKSKRVRNVRVALVLPTEYAYARGVMRGIIATTRERNLYASGVARRGRPEQLRWMLWSREREVGFRLEIERTFRARAQAAGDSSIAKAFTFSSYGAGDRQAPALTGTSIQRRRAAMSAWLKSLPKPLAIFAANDLWGSELIQ